MPSQRTSLFPDPSFGRAQRASNKTSLGPTLDLAREDSGAALWLGQPYGRRNGWPFVELYSRVWQNCLEKKSFCSASSLQLRCVSQTTLRANGRQGRWATVSGLIGAKVFAQRKGRARNPRPAKTAEP